MKRDSLFYFRVLPKDFLASEDFILLSLEQKGLLFHAMMACWANGSLPEAPTDLGRILALPRNRSKSCSPPSLVSLRRKTGALPARYSMRNAREPKDSPTETQRREWNLAKCDAGKGRRDKSL